MSGSYVVSSQQSNTEELKSTLFNSPVAGLTFIIVIIIIIIWTVSISDSDIPAVLRMRRHRVSQRPGLILQQNQTEQTSTQLRTDVQIVECDDLRCRTQTVFGFWTVVRLKKTFEGVTLDSEDIF